MVVAYDPRMGADRERSGVLSGGALVKAANDWMTRARRLAATVASC